MTPVDVDIPSREHHGPPLVRQIEEKAGTFGMWLFITTESCLFVAFFFAYYFVEKGNERWAVEKPPHLYYALPMLGVLILSSILLIWGGRQLERHGKMWPARLAVIASFILGLGYLALAYFDYSDHLQHLTQHTDAYGSIFYTITTVHGGHLILGLLMFLWLLRIPDWGPRKRPPHRPYQNVALYWHFVVVVWIFTVAILYIAPNVYTSL